ncbi:MAG: hypothetical protein RI935_15 [Candidatus Parcubacteria bacterium]|jgi:RND family efflux transporter MFP subunit
MTTTDHLQKIRYHLEKSYNEVIRLHKELPKKKGYALIACEIMLIGGVLIAVFGGTSSKEAVASERVRSVQVASLLELSSDSKDIPLVGTVTSVSEATILSESSGKLTRVYRKIGDQVVAGQIIAEFENSAERASTLQAEGAYEQAKASLQIAKLNSAQSGNSLNDVKNQALNTLYSAYTTMDDAIRGKTDIAYRDPRFSEAKFLLSVPDSSLVLNLEQQRKSLENLIVSRSERNKTITTSSDLQAELTTVIAELNTVKNYLDNLSLAYNKAIPDSTFNQTFIDTQKAVVQGVRSSVTGTINGTISTRTALTSSQTATQISGNNADITGTIAQAEAQVKQALGAYNAALARYQKTIIRSPITGTINSLSLNSGDYIGAFSQVAIVSNNKALEVVSFINEDDTKRIAIGSKATIVTSNGVSVEGIVTKVAQAIDPRTKKIEVRIGIIKDQNTLINGQSVRISVTSALKDTNPQPVTAGNTFKISIPLSALKLTPSGANVFVVNASNTLQSVAVKEGAVSGDQIEILEGLSGTEIIVKDARGLKEGFVVNVID